MRRNLLLLPVALAFAACGSPQSPSADRQALPLAIEILDLTMEACGRYSDEAAHMWELFDRIAPGLNRRSLAGYRAGGGAGRIDEIRIGEEEAELRVIAAEVAKQPFAGGLRDLRTAERDACRVATDPRASAVGPYRDEVSEAKRRYESLRKPLADLAEALDPEGRGQLALITQRMAAARAFGDTGFRQASREAEARAREAEALRAQAAEPEAPQEPERVVQFAKPPATSNPALTDNKALMVLHWTWGKEGGLCRILGLVQSSGTQTLAYAKAQIRLYDNRGRLIDTVDVYLDDKKLERFEQSAFTTSTRWQEGIVRATLGFIDRDEEPILATGAL